MLLEVDGLRYAYGERLAVQGVSFEVAPGEVFGLLGPNGAGKTTTILCLAGVFRRWEGEIRWEGEPFRPAERVGDRARLGWVPQELALYEGLSGRENLEFFGRLQGLRGTALAEAVDRALGLAGLADRARDRVRSWSGGMKRRLNIAIGDLHRPGLLLCDEPTVGVDPQSRNHIFDRLQTLKNEGRALLYTTHYMEEAQRLCDRVGIIHEGRIIACGTARELAAAAGDPDADLEQVFLHLTGRHLRDEG